MVSPPASINGNLNQVSTSPRRITLSNIGPWSWFVVDFLIATIFAAIAFSLTPYNVDFQQEALNRDHIGRLPFCIGTGLMVALVAHISGLHEHNQVRTTTKMFSRCALVTSTALLALNLELLLVHYLTVGRLITFFAFVGCTIGISSVRALVFGLVARNQFVVGYVGSKQFTDMFPIPSNTDTGHEFRSVFLTVREGESIDLRQWAIQNRVNQVVVDPHEKLTPSHSELLELMNISIIVSSYSNFVEKLHQRIPSKHITAQWVLDCQEDHAMIYKMAIKRALDIAIASIALVLLSPLGAIAAICVKLDSPGPVVFRFLDQLIRFEILVFPLTARLPFFL